MTEVAVEDDFSNFNPSKTSGEFSDTLGALSGVF